MASEIENLNSIKASIGILGKNFDNETFRLIEGFIPGIIHFNDRHDLSLKYCGKKLEDIIHLDNDEIIKDGLKHLMKIVHPYDAENTAPEIIEFFSDSHQTDQISFFQRLKKNIDEIDYQWFFTTTRSLKDSNDLISISLPIKNLIKIENQLFDLLEENIFLRKNFRKFHLLTKREKDILKELAVGKTAKQIAEEKFISIHTVKTHRQRIFEKLESKTFLELYKYAFHFGIL